MWWIDKRQLFIITKVPERILVYNMPHKGDKATSLGSLMVTKERMTPVSVLSWLNSLQYSVTTDYIERHLASKNPCHLSDKKSCFQSKWRKETEKNCLSRFT